MRSECHLTNSSPPTPLPLHRTPTPLSSLHFAFSCYSSISVTCPGGITVWYDPLPHNTRIPPPPHPPSPQPQPQLSSLPTNSIQSHKKGKGERGSERVTERGWLANKNNLCRLGLIALLCLAQRQKRVLNPHFSPLCFSPYQTGPSAKKMNRRDLDGGGETNMMDFSSHSEQ